MTTDERYILYKKIFNSTPKGNLICSSVYKIGLILDFLLSEDIFIAYSLILYFESEDIVQNRKLSV